MERGQLLGLDERELVDEVDEVFEAGVQVRFCREQHDVLEVRVVNVRVHTEQTLEDHFDYGFEVSGEGDSKGTREDFFIIELVFDPRHQKVNVFAC